MIQLDWSLDNVTYDTFLDVLYKGIEMQEASKIVDDMKE